jgi:hypothetical protein
MPLLGAVDTRGQDVPAGFENLPSISATDRYPPCAIAQDIRAPSIDRIQHSDPVDRDHLQSPLPNQSNLTIADMNAWLKVLDF